MLVRDMYTQALYSARFSISISGNGTRTASSLTIVYPLYIRLGDSYTRSLDFRSREFAIGVTEDLARRGYLWAICVFERKFRRPGRLSSPAAFANEHEARSWWRVVRWMRSTA